MLGRVLRRAVRVVRPPCGRPHSYGQEGEDLILARLFAGQAAGFYVDVGAHHPTRYSNTFLFYQDGWSGINIDAMPGAMASFDRLRPRDINLEVGIGAERGDLEFALFNEPALNTCDRSLAELRDGVQGFRIIGWKRVQVRPLAEVLGEFLPAEQKIDFLTVDVEGLDLAVLRSNDWKRFRPLYVLAEICGVPTLRETMDTPLCQFMDSVGYEFAAKTVNTCFFRDCAERQSV